MQTADIMRGSAMRKAEFIDPMLLLLTSKLPEGDQWLYELKLDGYRALAIKRDGSVRLVSRNGNDFGKRYPAILAALRELPDETVIDGEVVALDESGRPSFSALQNYGSTSGPLLYCRMGKKLDPIENAGFSR